MKKNIIAILFLTLILAGLTYYSQQPVPTLQRLLLAGLIHGTLEWLPADPFGYFPMLAYSHLGFSGLSLETLVPYLKLGSIVVVIVKLFEDFTGLVSLLFARAWSQIWEMELIPIEDIAKIVAGLFAAFASSQFLVMTGSFSSVQPFLLEFFSQVTSLSLGLALILVGMVTRKMGRRIGESRAGILVKLNLGQLIVTGMVIGLLSIPGVNSGPAGFAVLTIGGFEPELGLRIQYVMMVPLFAKIFAEAYSGSTLILPVGLDFVQTMLVVFAVALFGYIVLTVLIAVANRLGAPEMCIIFGLLLVAVFAMQEGVSGRFWDLLTLVRRYIS